MIDIANVQYRLVIMDEKRKAVQHQRIMWMIWGGNREKKNCPPESPLPRGMRESTQGLLSSIAKLGCLVGIFATDGKKDEEVARGYITTWKPSYSSDSDRFDVKCYDNLYNLRESQDNIYYSSGIGTKSAIMKIFDNWEIPLGSYSGPNETHAKLAYKSESLAYVILDILDDAYKRAEQNVWFRIEVVKCMWFHMPTIRWFTTLRQITQKQYPIKRSTEGMITRVKIIYQEE